VANWIRVAAVEAVPTGELLGVEAAGKPIVLANVDGDLYALEDQCSHQEFPLSDGFLEGDRLECAWHGAEFDVCTGRAMSLPAIRPVKTFNVEIRESDIFIDVG
jgi:nitrite reductase/ring-hydroxylating ferredoxin subunit